MDILELIAKSGNSNGADREDFQQLLEPVIREMSELSPGHFDGAPEPQEQKDTTQAAQQAAENTKAPDWARLREMLQKAPLKDLSVAMAVIMSRFDDELVSK